MTGGPFYNKVAERYGPQTNPAFGLFLIEAWNEPNIQQFWSDFDSNGGWNGPDPELFAKMVKEVDFTVSDNGIDVLPGALSPGGGWGGEMADANDDNS